MKSTIPRVAFPAVNRKMTVMPELAMSHPLGGDLRRDYTPADAPFVVLSGKVALGTRLFERTLYMISWLDIVEPGRLKQLRFHLLEFRTNVVLKRGINWLQFWVEIA